MIFVCGWPGSGKSALAELLANEFGVHRVDIDEVRALMIGMPYPRPNESPDLMKRDIEEMDGAYRALFDNIDWHLAAERSILGTATLSSRPHGQGKLRPIYENYPTVRARIIQCVPRRDAPEAVAAMMARRAGAFGTTAGYKGGVNSPPSATSK